MTTARARGSVSTPPGSADKESRRRGRFHPCASIPDAKRPASSLLPKRSPRAKGERSAPPPLASPPAGCRSGAAGLWRGARRLGAHARHPHRIPRCASRASAIRWGCRPCRAFANPRLPSSPRATGPSSRARRPCIGGRSGTAPLFCGGSVEAVGRIRQKMRIGLRKRLNAVHRRDVQKGQEGAFR